MSCEHLNFTAQVNVHRILPAGKLKPEDEGRPPVKGDDAVAFSAEITVACVDCGERFGFRCQDVGMLPDRPCVSPDALEIRLPLISPSELELLGPLAAMRTPSSIPGYGVRRRA